MFRFFKRNKFKGIFKDWEINECTARRGSFQLWIFFGFNRFRDWGLPSFPAEPFLSTYNDRDRKLLWIEMEKEINKRKEVKENDI